MNGIRVATLSDVSAVARVHVTCWHESYDGLVPPSLLSAFTLERSQAVWGRILCEPTAFNSAMVYVAEDDGKVVGFGSCSAQRSPDLAAQAYDGEISSIYLLRAFQRRGLGTALMRCLAADLLGRGFTAVSLWVLRENERARQFYVGCGGCLIGERTDVRENIALQEVAYGWRALSGLRDLTAASGTHPRLGSTA